MKIYELTDTTLNEVASEIIDNWTTIGNAPDKYSSHQMLKEAILSHCVEHIDLMKEMEDRLNKEIQSNHQATVENSSLKLEIEELYRTISSLEESSTLDRFFGF